MHGRRTALRYSPSTPSPAGARSRGQSTVLPFGSGWSAPSPSWRVPGGRCVRRVWQHAIRGSRYQALPYFVIYGTCVGLAIAVRVLLLSIQYIVFWSLLLSAEGTEGST